ncbi:hypothetical protein KHP62_14140 [Rhodobacteraceae bacterium NNCM2]|nr:hypothetical protein [Coraliihabitans acroporae]
MPNNTIFQNACDIQSQISGPLSRFAITCNKAVYDAAKNAAANTADNTPHIVNPGTGTGKTTFTVSLIAASVSALDSYSAAYVVATIDEAQRVYNLLATLVPEGACAIYTSAHKSLDAAQAHGDLVLKHVENAGPSSRVILAQSPVIVCTHEQWIAEGCLSRNFGVRMFSGVPRTNVFLDEFPDTISIETVLPSNLDYLADELDRCPDYHEAACIVREVAQRYRERCGANDRRFDVAQLLPGNSWLALESIDRSKFSDATDRQKLDNALEVLSKARHGRCFLSRSKGRANGQLHGHKTLVAYDDRFRAHPGLVILDATADLAPQVLADLPFHRYRGEQVDYRNLKATHLQQPERFETIASRTASDALVREYAAWIKGVVRKFSDDSEEVLIVVSKKVAASLNEGDPIPGRKVKVATWGMGIGSNAYRDCGAVFLFSEFHVPRQVYLARSLASRGVAATEDDVRQVNGASCTGAVERSSIAHRSRQLKQMASRGRIRQLDGDGVAKAMRLYTTMDRALFVEVFASLFPAASSPEFINNCPETLNTKGKRLLAYLTEQSADHRPRELSASEIEERTGILSKGLKQAFGSRQCKSLRNNGWEFVPDAGRKSKPSLRYAPILTQLLDGLRLVLSSQLA